MQFSPARSVTCPICHGGPASVFMELPDVPVFCNVLYGSRALATESPRGDIALAYCPACSHVFNAAFDPVKVAYSPDYENSLHFSGRFQRYAEELSDRLIRAHSLQNKDLVEIGCGGGDFLKMLCSKGGNRGVGFDPGYRGPNVEPTSVGDVTFIRGEFTEQHATLPADFVCSRHVLEHLVEPLSLLKLIRRTIASDAGTRLYVEVPNVLYTLRDQGIWDLIYEHVGYYTAQSMASLCEQAGFEVIRLCEAYEGQFLSVDLRTLPGGTRGEASHRNGIDDVSVLVERFAGAYEKKRGEWESILARAADRGERVVAWGAGSKGVTFLNVLRSHGQIQSIVDINPRKHGKFVAGTGQEVIPPEHLTQDPPDLVVLMNPVYLEEVRTCLERLGVRAAVALA